MPYVIYKICSDDCPDFIYVGSTKNFTKRKYSHKFDYKNGCNFTLYNKIREYGGWENWRMVTVEDLGDVNLTQARIKEEEWRLKLRGNLNMNKCHLTEEERLKYQKEYHNSHKEDANETRREKGSQKVECECGSIVRRDDLRRHERSKKHFNLLQKKN